MKTSSNAYQCGDCGDYFAEVSKTRDGFLCKKCYDGRKPPPTLTSQVSKLFADIINTIGAKNGDYAGNRGEFYNFEFSAQIANGTVEQGILFRLADKIARLSNLMVRESLVTNESIDDTIKDAIGYLAILYSYREQKNSRG